MKKKLSWLLLLVLLISSMPVFAADGPVTHYELRTGVVFAWSNSSGVWQKGIEAGKVYNKPSTTVYDIGALYPKEKVENVTAYPYTLDFDFSKLGDNWNKTQFANDMATYNENYYGQAATGIKMSNSWNAKTGKLEYTYSGTLSAINGNPIDVKAVLRLGKLNDIYTMMGYTADTVPADIKNAMDELYPKAGQSPKVQGFLYFVPFIIQYDVVPEVVLPLLPPKCVLDCNTGSAFIGKSTPVKGYVINQNTYPVIMRYEITANGKSFYSGSKVMNAKEKLSLSTGFTIPGSAKPGTKYEFQIVAKNVGQTEGPPDQYRYHFVYSHNDHDTDQMLSQAEWDKMLSQSDRDTRTTLTENVTQLTNPDWTSYMGAHSQDASGAWYLKAAEWKTGVSNVCKRYAVPQPLAPVDHGLQPSVIIE